ncbi:MAG: type III pantothenate kinase [Nitrospirae bacterium]|nr:type III pantothenate kinase [Nitrospirota bacterium]
MNALLAVDIGNSTIGFGLFPEPAGDAGLFIRKIPVRPVRSPRTYRKVIAGLLKETAPNTHQRGPGPGNYTINTIISSVVPSLNRVLAESLSSLSEEKPLMVSSRLNSGLTFETERPEETGADRIANAVAGYSYTKGPVAVADFGTATTLTIVGKKRNFLGGAILPGIQLMRKSLRAETAKLPLIDLTRPERALGKSTVSSIASGIVFGTVGAVEILVKSMEKELDFKLQLVLTGGNAQLVAPLIKRDHKLIPDLTFEGLRLIYLRTVASSR